MAEYPDWKHCDGCTDLEGCEAHGCLKESKVELDDCEETDPKTDVLSTSLEPAENGGIEPVNADDSQKSPQQVFGPIGGNL